MFKNLFGLRRDASNEKGYTLLEYAVGAAILMAIVMVGLNAFGTGLQQFFTNLGTWVQSVSPVALNS